MSLARRLAGVGLVLTLAGGCAAEPDRGEDAPVRDDALSRLDREGVQRIEETGRAVLDLRDREVTRADVGLGERELGPVVGRPGGDPITLVLETPEGSEEVRTSSFSVAFNEPGGPASYVTWFEGFDSDEQAFVALDGAVERWGIPAADVRRWRDRSAEGASGGGARPSMALGPGLGPSGLVAEVEARAGRTGQTLQYSLLLDDRVYTPETMQRWRRGGD